MPVFLTKKIIILCYFFLIFLFLTNAIAENETEKKRPYQILILHSYHQGYTWTDTITRAMLDEINLEILEEYNVYIEYMDTKNHPPERIFPELEDLLIEKYAHGFFDVILCCDDNALQFIFKYGESIFPGTPVIFCGINNEKNAIEAKKRGYTGIIENLNYPGTIDIALSLKPKTQYVVITMDNSTTTQANFKLFQSIMPKYEHFVDLIELNDLNKDEFVEELGALPQNSIIVNLGLMRTRDGVTFTLEKSIEFIAHHSNMPIFAVVDMEIGHGAVGGDVISGAKQGTLCADLASRILEGESPKNIPLIDDNTTSYIFDYNALDKYGISESSLPEGSILINKPVSLYGEHKKIIWAAFMVFLAQSISILFLLVNRQLKYRAENALRKSEEKYRQLVESMNEGLVIVSKDGLLSYVNPFLCNLLGYSNDELTNHPIDKILDEKDLEKFIRQFESRALGNENNYEITLITKDGQEKRTIIAPKSMFDSSGNFQGSTAVVMDVTERKKLEAEMIQADKMISLGILVSGVAHEINNPNNIITINTPVIDKIWKSLLPILNEYYKAQGDFKLAGLPYSDMKKRMPMLISGISDGTRRIKRIVQDLKRFAQPAVSTHSELININTMVRSALNLIANMIKKQTEHFVVDYGVDLPPLKGDYQRLEQVVINMVQNACLSLDDKTKAVYVATSFKDGNIEIKIQDEGCGIPSADLPKLTDPFFTTRRDSGGTGLGLSVSAGIIREHNGKIIIDSKPGKGSTFTVILPVPDSHKRLKKESV